MNDRDDHIDHAGAGGGDVGDDIGSMGHKRVNCDNIKFNGVDTDVDHRSDDLGGGGVGGGDGDEDDVGGRSNGKIDRDGGC